MSTIVGVRLALSGVALLGSIGVCEGASDVPKLKCSHVKTVYKAAECCGNPDKELSMSLTSFPQRSSKLFGSLQADNTDHNPCHGKKPQEPSAYDNRPCKDGDSVASDVKEQAGANITQGYNGLFDTDALPFMDPYWTNQMCPVNVHWHLGAEHLSVGEFDEAGVGPDIAAEEDEDGEEDSRLRRLAVARRGHRCHLYDSGDTRFDDDSYTWHHCVGMHVGETYEVHWPHSKGGACGTPWQYQTPFYDGVFCHGDKLAPTTQEAIGVQGQIFTIINDEAYYYPDLIRGMIVLGDYGKSENIAKYTGSTTGTSRSNEVCSGYTPITWQVDRKCHYISASSFDKMCADMKNQLDDMSSDLHAHGARETVDDIIAADNFARV